MTTEDFSNRFDVLLNSYSQQFLFGNGGNRGDIQLDEYEKSSLLSQAQDDIIKSYFVGDSANGGFDDSTRRQIDFSSLIKVANIYPTSGTTFDKRGILYQLPTTKQSYKEVAVGEIGKASIEDYVKSMEPEEFPGRPSVSIYNYFCFKDSNGNIVDLSEIKVGQKVTLQGELIGTLSGELYQEDRYNSETYVVDLIDSTRPAEGDVQAGITFLISKGFQTNAASIISIDYSGYTDEEKADPFTLKLSYEDTSTLVETGTTDVLYILNEKLTDKETGLEYVIVPINYKEYDREMSKPYAQPYKKQAWRLLQNITTGFDLVSELIPTQTLIDLHHTYIYKIRYVKRPTPIILVDLPNGLQIDGYSAKTECTLNPILHNDILQRAVDLAIQTRLSTSARYDSLNKRNNNNQQ